VLDWFFGPSVTQQARQELAQDDRRRKVNAKKAQIEQRRLNRQGLAHNLAEMFFGS
jgi:hypothetical protein